MVLGVLICAPAAGAATFSGSATPTAPLGGSIIDTATLDVAPPMSPAPTGTITFNVYGPNDPICAAPIPEAQRMVAVSGNGSYVSNPPFVPTAVGTYHWDLAYSGDVNYPALAAPCDPLNTAQTSVITPAVNQPPPQAGATTPTAVVTTTTTTKKKCKKKKRKRCKKRR